MRGLYRCANADISPFLECWSRTTKNARYWILLYE